MALWPPRGHFTDSPDNGALLSKKLRLYSGRGGHEGHFWLSEEMDALGRLWDVPSAEKRLEVCPSKLFSASWFFKENSQRRKSGAHDVYGGADSWWCATENAADIWTGFIHPSLQVMDKRSTKKLFSTLICLPLLQLKGDRRRMVKEVKRLLKQPRVEMKEQHKAEEKTQMTGWMCWLRTAEKHRSSSST